jgi:hypothetical protein
MQPVARRLTAVVSYTRASGKVRTVSTVILKLGPLVVGWGTLGGRWTAEQAVAEFRKQPGRFRLAKGWSAAMLAGLAA